VIASSVAIAVVLAWASFSWACGLYAEQPTAAVSPSRASAASDVTVTGTGWQPSSLVSLSLSTDGSTTLQPLGDATAAGDGSFTTRVRIADRPAGVYYVSAHQGTMRTNIPVEVTDVRGAITGGQWKGLTGSAQAPGIGALAKPKPTPAHFPIGTVALTAGILALFGTVTALELRRQRASS
jgi:ABC-type phosphate transport system substrate-binding protein